MKVLLVMLILCWCGFLIALELQLGLNYDGMGEYKRYQAVGFVAFTSMQDGISPYFQMMFPFNYAKAGLGVQYQMPREIKHGYNDFWYIRHTKPEVSFIPVYAVVQIPVHDKYLPIETIGELGYCFHQGNKEYQYYHDYNTGTKKASLKGGFHAGGGIAIVKKPLVFKFMIQSEQVDYSETNGRTSRVDTYHYSLGIEYRLKVTGTKK